METYHPETTHLTATCSCEACAAFTRVAARTLAPSPIRDLLHRRLQPFRHLHDCSGCFRLERSPGGTCTHWKAPPSHGARKERSFPHNSANWPNRSKRKSGAARERIVPPRPISAVGRRALRVNRPCPVPDVLYQIPIRRPPWDFWREVNRTPVSPKLLGEAMELHANMAPEDRPVVEARAFQLFEFSQRKGLHRQTPFRSSILILSFVRFRLGLRRFPGF